jgi:hypothetical protein
MFSAKCSCQLDILAILVCLFPIFLRPKEEGYDYMRECFLHGFIDGETLALVEFFRVEEVSLV